MPSAMPVFRPGNGISKFTNCRLLRGESLVWDDIWISSATGKIVTSQSAFYDELIRPDAVVDLGGRIVSPGLIECQLNGAFGFNFSTVSGDMAHYDKQVRGLNRKLVQTGVTSYMPTVTSQISDLYKTVLPFLGPSGVPRSAGDGAESLGAHCEGPFLNSARNGVHNADVLCTAESVADVDDMYGSVNVDPSFDPLAVPRIKMVTLAPELGNATGLIPALAARGIVVSMGHSEATYEQASAAVAQGATMITHLFNAMSPPHHRNPGLLGLLGHRASSRPYFSLISDGTHLHPTTVCIAWKAHPEGCILVTDAMHMMGLPDGTYPWTNGDAEHFITKKGAVCLLEGSDRIAGSSITLVECVNNFLAFTGATVPQALKAVTTTPATMLGIKGVKGVLDPNADADLVIFSEKNIGSAMTTKLIVDEVWKFGVKVFESGVSSMAE